MIALEMGLKDGEGSLLLSPLKYKRRKVSAVRDFPPGCGPTGIRRSIDTTVEGHDEGISLTNAEASEENGGRQCEADGKGLSEGMVTGHDHDVLVCPNGVLLEAFKNDESQNLSVGSPSKLLQEIQTVEGISLMTNRENDPSDLVEVEIPLHDLGEVATEPANPNKNITTEEGTNVQQRLFPHYPIPSTVPWKMPKYPPRRRVSAVRDFPAGCGYNMLRLSQTEDKRVVLGETDAKMHEASMLNQNERNLDRDNGFNDEIHGTDSGRNGDTLVKQSDTDDDAAAKLIVDEILFKIKEQENGYDENIEQSLTVMKQSGSGGGKNCWESDSSPEELDRDLIVYVKDTNRKRKSSVGASSSNIELPGEFEAGLEKSSPSRVTAKESLGKKNGSDARDKSKCSVNKGLKKTGKISEMSVTVVPHSKDKETEMDTAIYATPLAVRYEEDSSENEEDNFQFLPRKAERNVTLPPSNPCTSRERGARSKVKETLRLFQAVVRKILQGEETKSKENAKSGKRIDLCASNVLKEKGKYINTKKVIGPVPGVEVGDIFSYRIELAIIGLHSPLQSGIDTIKKGKIYIAISVVASGGYDNDIDSSDVLIYTGQGGNPAGADKQPEDQKLRTGNLALKNCIEEKTPVRVIRGFKEAKPADGVNTKPKMIATYTYDGLYSIERCWQDVGPHGKLVYKFELRRIPGQPELAWKELKQSKKFKAREGRCVDDISGGKEKQPICAINTVDDEQPPPFTYIVKMIYPDWCRPIPLKGCYCKNGCSDSECCSCAVMNGGEIPYNFSGAIVEAKPLVYECGPSCKCPPSCPNRVSQHGIKLPLEIFKTESRGWGVRCLSSIPSGSFICEYIGELLDEKEADQRTGSDEYLFDIGQNYNDPTVTEGLSDVMADMASSATAVVENVGFTIDAAKFGNIGRFINHSCSPNLYAQNVLYKHEDKRIPHIMFFAVENIPPLQELTYHYNYTIDQVFDAQGKIKRKDCHCGSSECTGRMY